MSLLDDLRANIATKEPTITPIEYKAPPPVLDPNAQDLYDKMIELHPGRTVEVEHWTVMRVYDDNRLCIDVRRSISHE